MEKEVKKKRDWWKNILLIILIIYLIGVFSSNNNEEISNCVNECVLEINNCMTSSSLFDSIYDKSGVIEYIPYSDFEDCYLDLETCINNCEE